MEKLCSHLVAATKVIGVIFSVIGVMATLRWVFSWSGHPPDSPCSDVPTDACPWKHVFSDLSNRLHLLELAFKEQVVAREAIAQEVVNQSDLNSILDRKLSIFIERVETLHGEIAQLDGKFMDLHSRISSDESVGFLVVIVLVIEIVMRVRPSVRLLQLWAKHRASPRGRTGSPDTKKETTSAKNGSLNFSPKHGITLRNELCVVLFNNENIYTALVEAIFRHFDGVRLSVRPYYVVEGQEDLRHMPYSKMFLVFAECDPKKSSLVTSKDGTQLDLQIATVRVIKALGAAIVVILTNDEGSKRLTAHVLYNSNLRAVQSQEILQELASCGRLFSIWKELTSHQISHMRKITGSVLNVRHNVAK